MFACVRGIINFRETNSVILTVSEKDDFTEFLFQIKWRELNARIFLLKKFECDTQCEQCENMEILSRTFFDKNFVKAMVLLKKLLKS